MSVTLVLRMCATVSQSLSSLWLGSALSSDTEVQQNLPPGGTGPVGTPSAIRECGPSGLSSGPSVSLPNREPMHSRCPRLTPTNPPRVICIHTLSSEPSLLYTSCFLPSFFFLKITWEKKRLSTHSLFPPLPLTPTSPAFLELHWKG